MLHYIFFPKKIGFALLVSTLLGASPSFAQEAFIAQIGDNNFGVNVDFAGKALNVIAQVGDKNAATQINLAGQNTLATVQMGNRNDSLALTAGAGNLVGTVQLGFGHSAVSIVNGDNNQVATLQSGKRNSSRLLLDGSNADVDITQNGRGLKSNLNIQDNYVPTTTTGRISTSTNTSGGLDVMVNQSMGDPAVFASVIRDSAGNIMIRPGSATTVLKLSQ